MQSAVAGWVLVKEDALETFSHQVVSAPADPPASTTPSSSAASSELESKEVVGETSPDAIMPSTSSSSRKAFPVQLKGPWTYLSTVIKIPRHFQDADTLMLTLHVKLEEKFLEATSDANFPAGPEGQVFLNNQRAGAFDREHRRITLDAQLLHGAGDLHVDIVLFTGRVPSAHMLQTIEVECRHRLTESVHHDLRVGLDVLRQISPEGNSYRQLIDVLDAASRQLDFRLAKELSSDVRGFFHSVRAAYDLLRRHNVRAMLHIPDHPPVAAVGTSHIDLAWLWEIGQTKHKTVRTMATQLRLLRQFPQWTFMQSTPQVYEWLRLHAPDLFDGVLQAIKSGRWEADGAMWCEADTNVPSGESLARQLLYGKRYFRDVLGVDSRVLWLPDVFGYSAALPQLLRLARVPYFVTSKVSWSQFNRFPYDAFHWQGLDGSTVLTQFITTPPFWGTDTTYYTYNSLFEVSEVKGAWAKFQQKTTGQTPLLTFGFGDGGGGPTELMLETAQRMEDGGAVKMTNVNALLDNLQQIASATKLPRWVGELYLEYHRGTYTSQAAIKRANRQGEVLFQQAEFALSLLIQFGLPHPSGSGGRLLQEEMRGMWQDFLTLQFHDILPGSSTHNVYEFEALPTHGRIAVRLREILVECAQIFARSMESGCRHGRQLKLNTLWFARDGIPAAGWKLAEEPPVSGRGAVSAAVASVESSASALPRRRYAKISADGLTIESHRWIAILDPQSSRILSLVDKENGRRQIVSPFAGSSLNEFQFFRDDSMMWSAWDIDSYYQEMPVAGLVLQKTTVVEHGPDVVRVRKHYVMPPRNLSTVVQDIVVYGDGSTDRIDFETRATWTDADEKVLWKAAFAVDIHATEANHEVQFGYLKRPTHLNTQWDVARFETCAQRWIDLSEANYGVALLNDGKYGHDVQHHVMRLTLLKVPVSPDPKADRGDHAFTYSLYPHTGPLEQSLVVSEAASLNNPTVNVSVPASAASDSIGADATAAQLPVPVAGSALHLVDEADVRRGIVIDSMKPAEDQFSSAVLVRLYEAHGGRHYNVGLVFARPVRHIRAVDLLEDGSDERTKVAVSDSSDRRRVTIETVAPFQVVSLLVEFEHPVEVSMSSTVSL